MFIKHSKRTIRSGCPSCGNTELYFAHDTDNPTDNYCDDCDASGSLVLIDKDGNLHSCNGTPATPVVAEQESTPVTTTPTATSDPRMAALELLLSGPQIDKAEVERIAREVVGEVVFPTRTVVVKDTVTTEMEGEFTHQALGDVLDAVLAGEHVFMVGPAGTGKSTIAEQVATLRELTFRSLSVGPMTTEAQMKGYVTAHGETVRTPFREAFEHGGVFLLDEVDNGNPGVLTILNAALANGVMSFPDGMVQRHSEFVVIAAANTYGLGPDRQYVGRQQLDAAFLDRFAMVEVPVDEALEQSVCMVYADQATVTKVLKFIRGIRKNAEDKGIRVVVSPRASIGMCRLLAQNVMWDKAVDFRVRRGLDTATWNKLVGA